jgi:MFS superfamily sulfate permease-like transporter
MLVVASTAASASASIVAAVLAGLGAPDAATYAALVAVLVIATGVFFVLAGLFRLGFVMTYRASRASAAVLARRPGVPDDWRDRSRHPDWETAQGVLVLRGNSQLFYANAVADTDAIRRHVGAADPTHTVVLDVEATRTLDIGCSWPAWTMPSWPSPSAPGSSTSWGAPTSTTRSTRPWPPHSSSRRDRRSR